MTGVNVVFYRSEKKNGKFTSKYNTVNGSPNGFYKAFTNTIYLDINAGTTGKGTILFTAAHELVHVIRTWSPKSFTTFANFLMEKYAEKGESVNKLIRDKMNKLGLSYDMAYEEVVADSCESFLVDSNIVQRIQELAQKDKSLVQKIKSYLKNLLNAIKKAYEKLVPESEEGRIVREMRDSIDELHNKFYEALKSASDNIHNSEVSTTKNTANDDGVKYSLNRNAKTELHKALYDMSYREDVLLRDVTPPIMLAQKGVKNLPMVMKSSHIRENVFTEAEAKQLGLRVDKHTHYHGLGEDFYLDIIDGLDSVTEAYRGTKNADDTSRRENYFLLISKFEDTNGNIINVPVYINETAQHNRVFIDSNKISTVFGRENFRAYIFNEIKNGNLVKIKNKSNTSSERNALIAKGYRSTASDNIISQVDNTVNNQSMQKDRKNSLRDNEYLEAVNNGDMETAQRMVDEYAEEIFSNSKIRDEDGRLLKVYHGTDADFTVFDKTKGRSSMDIQGMFFSPWDIDAKGYGPNVRAFYLNITNPANESTGYRYLRKYRGQYYAGTKAREELESIGYDGVNNENEEFIAFNSEQIKSADPVTYDDNGDVIPLSKRFDVENEDIRYQARPDFDDFIFEDFDGEVTDNDARLMTEYLRQGKTDIVSHLINQTRNIEMADGKIRSLVNRLIKSYDLSTTSNKDIQLAVMSLLESTNKTEVEENLDLLQGVLSKVVRESNYISEADREFKAEVNEFLKDYRKEYNVYPNDEQLSSLEFQGCSVA